jgi:outer membrane protein assembly factor BamB
VRCLKAEDGSVIWERNLNDFYRVKVLECRPSPLIDGNLLIFSSASRPGACVIALDKNSGEEVWKALDEPASNSSPLIITSGGQKQFIVWTGTSITSLDPATGKVHWREPLVTSNNDSIATPVFHENLLLISGLMFKMDPDQPAASILWPEVKGISKRILSNTCTPLFQGNHIYAARSSGELVCLEASTGRELWQTNSVTELKNGASIHLTPTRDSVFLYTDQGNLILARLTPHGYQEISRDHLMKPTSFLSQQKHAWPPPAYANGHVLLRNDEELVCADLRP